jgi:hypothetical protein
MASSKPATSSNRPVGWAKLAGRLVAVSICAVGPGSAIFCRPETTNIAASNRRPMTAAIMDMALLPMAALPAVEC